jgi:hypothetical protein
MGCEIGMREASGVCLPADGTSPARVSTPETRVRAGIGATQGAANAGTRDGAFLPSVKSTTSPGQTGSVYGDVRAIPSDASTLNSQQLQDMVGVVEMLKRGIDPDAVQAQIGLTAKQREQENPMPSGEVSLLKILCSNGMPEWKLTQINALAVLYENDPSLPPDLIVTATKKLLEQILDDKNIIKRLTLRENSMPSGEVSLLKILGGNDKPARKLDQIDALAVLYENDPSLPPHLIVAARAILENRMMGP